MIKITRIEVAGKLIPIGKNCPRCINTAELTAYRYELWADHCRRRHIEFDKEDAHNGVLFIFKKLTE